MTMRRVAVSDLEKIFKSESGRVLATLMRILRDLDLAEEALQESFSAALVTWRQNGIPDNPYGWLVSAGKFKAIDTIRRSDHGKALLKNLHLHREAGEPIDQENQYIEKYLVHDDQLRLIFLCCHPRLSMEARICLSLRELCGLSTKEIARGLLTSPENIKKRISRAKNLIKDEKIPYGIPDKDHLDERVNTVLQVIYLIYNEAYSVLHSKDQNRQALVHQALYLSRKLVELLPSSETYGLLALVLIQESRHAARMSDQGDIIPLEYQDRSLWDQKMIDEGRGLIHQAVMSGRLGIYSLQAAIASVHAVADSTQSTRWDLIVGYYDLLLSIHNSPVIELNRAVAIGMKDGPETALKILMNLRNDPKLSSYHILYSTEAEFAKQIGLHDQSSKAYQRAIKLASSPADIKYLQQQLDAVQGILQN